LENQSEVEESENANSVSGSAPEKPAVGAIDYLLTVVFFFSFLVLLLCWDLVQRISYFVFGEQALHRVDRTLNWLILQLLRITGARVRYSNPFVFPNTDSYILITNHQSMFDICLVHELVWQHTPRFIAKKELGKWIPGISFNLRAGGHPLIDRSRANQALGEIMQLGGRLDRERFAAVIFPEGTRARNGALKKFRPSGLTALFRAAPRAKIIVAAIEGSWRFQTFNCWPIPKGTSIQLSVLDLFEQSRFESGEEIIRYSEALIAGKLSEWRQPNLEPSSASARDGASASAHAQGGIRAP